jgi:voltage-gated potassium channel Kch
VSGRERARASPASRPAGVHRPAANNALVSDRAADNLREPAPKRRRPSPHHGFGIVLMLVLVSVSFQVAVPNTNWSRLVMVVLGAGTLLASVWAAQARHVIVRAGVLAAVGLAAASVVTELVFGGVPESVAALVNGLLILLAPGVIALALVSELRAELQVTLRTLSGVLAIYLLLGMFFSFVDGAVAQLTTEPYFRSEPVPERSDFLYFSYITLSTVGYGDLVPATDLGRMLAVAEALVGQIYLVTVVALIVANFRPRRAESTQGSGA